MANRYDIVTGKVSLQPEKEAEPSILTFGMDIPIIWGGEVKHQPKVSFFRPQLNQSPRVCLVDADSTQLFTVAKVHWSNSRQYVLCRNPTSTTCCDLLGKSRWRLGSVLFQYDEILDMESPGGFITAWLFSERIFTQIKDINRRFPLNEHDLIIRCEEDRFRTYSYTACPESYFNRNREAMLTRFSEDIEACRQWIRSHMGNNLSEEELRNLPPNPPKPWRTRPAITRENTTARIATGNVESDDDFFQRLIP